MKRFYIGMVCYLIALIGVTACSTIASTSASTQTQQIETACETSATALKALAIVAPSIPKADLQGVTNAAAVVAPFCTSTTPPTYTTEQVTALTAAVAALTALETKYATPTRTQ